jgi:hypothetical protein
MDGSCSTKKRTAKMSTKLVFRNIKNKTSYKLGRDWKARTNVSYRNIIFMCGTNSSLSVWEPVPSSYRQNTSVYVINSLGLLCLWATVKGRKWGTAVQAETLRVRFPIWPWPRNQFFFWHFSLSGTLASSKIVLHHVSIFLSASKQYIFKGVG